MGRRQSTVQNVIKHGMAEVMKKNKTEPMCAEHVYISSTVMAKVRDAKWGPQMKASGYANRVIYHPCEGPGM